MQITEKNGVRIGIYEPGNGTRYTAIAVPIEPDTPLGALGYVEQGWLVVSGNTARAYLFQKSGYLLDYYIQENLGGHRGDYPYMGDLIRALIERELPTAEE